MLALLAGMLLLALWARLGRCPNLTVTLLARLARMLQGALLAQMDLEPLEHSVLVMALDSGLTEGISHLEPLQHSVLNAALVARPMEGIPVMEPLEHSVLAITLDDGPLEEIPDLEPLEHSVLEMALDSGLTEGISHLEPLEHSVLNTALDNRPMEGIPVRAFGSGYGPGQWIREGGWWTEVWFGPQTNIFGNTPRNEE